MTEILFASHAVAPCVDLRAMFGERFRFTDDPSLAAERSDRRRTERARLTRIPCAAGGFIAPAGGRRLLAFATTRRRRLRDLRCVRIAQDGGDELIVTFDVTDLEAVATVLGAKRRRRLSDQHRAKLKAAGSKTRFSTPETTITLETEQSVA
jgi:hypothetical protein